MQKSWHFNGQLGLYRKSQVQDQKNCCFLGLIKEFFSIGPKQYEEAQEQHEKAKKLGPQRIFFSIDPMYIYFQQLIANSKQMI